MRVKSTRRHCNGASLGIPVHVQKTSLKGGLIMSVTSASSAAAKKPRVPLAEIDVRGTEAVKQLGRVLPTSTGRSMRASTFNSAL